MASKLGKLNTSLLIDESSRPRYGPDDALTGRVVLRYNPATALFKKDPITADLFGPIRINVILVGTLKIHIRRDKTHTYHGGTLFAKPFYVYEGTFSAQVNRDYAFPFVANFPEIASVDGMGWGLQGGGNALPPTFGMHFSDYPDVVDVSVVYQLGAKVEMPGIDIRISVPEGNGAPQVKYDIPRPPLSHIEDNRSVFSNRTSVQNEYLLPESHRPSGFKAKAKAVFSSSQFPIFTVDVFCTDQKNIHVGQHLNFNIRLIRNDSKSSSIDDDFYPTITLEGFRADVRAYTIVDSSSRFIGGNQCHDSRTVQRLNSQTPLPIEFRKEWSVDISTGPVMKHTSSFSHLKISRMYQLKVDLRLKIANKSIKIVKECPVMLLPPPIELGEDYASKIPIEEPPPPIEAGPSGSKEEDEGEELPPPTYEEAGSSKLVKTG